MIIEMLKNIWPINKLYNLSDRVYQLKSQYLDNILSKKVS